MTKYLNGDGPMPDFDPGVLPPTDAEELAQLRAWKAEQMEVLAQLQLEECAKYLPVQLGESIPAAILPALKLAMEPKPPLFSVDMESGDAKPIYPPDAHAVIKAANRPQTSNIHIRMVVNGDLVTFDGSWLKAL
jgi:hypothetical protein